MQDTQVPMTVSVEPCVGKLPHRLDRAPSADTPRWVSFTGGNTNQGPVCDALVQARV